MKVTGSGLLIPESVTEDSFPFVCRVCKARFRSQAGWERHVVSCAESHEGDLHERSLRNEGFFQSPDPELEGWVAENRDAILEGRKKLGS